MKGKTKTNRKMHIRDAENQMRDLVRENLRKETKDFEELFSDTEEWILFLTAAPSNPESAKRFPMTPSDVSRTRKRINVETIIESVEEDEAMPLPERVPVEPIQPVRRGSRTAFKLASMKMKEPNLNSKLRRPEHSNDTNSTLSDAPPQKRARKGKSNMPKADLSSATADLSFASARDSKASYLNKRVKDEPMETDDDIILEKVQSSKISTFDNMTKKSSLRVKTVTLTRSSKRVTKQLITTVVESPVRSKAKKASTVRLSVDMFSDSPATESEDDIPIINFVTESKQSKLSKLKQTEPVPVKEQIVATKSNAENCNNGTSLITINGRTPVVRLQRIDAEPLQNCCPHSEITPLAASNSNGAVTISTDVVRKKFREDAADLKLIHYDDKSKTPAEELVAAAEDMSIVVAPIIQAPAEKKLKDSKQNALCDATNRNTPEKIRNLMNRNFEPVSVKKRVEALEQELIVEPVVPAMPNVPVRMTRTKVRAMMASLSAVTALPEKKATQKMETSHLLKIARKSLIRATKISLAKERSKVNLQQSLEKENASPPRNVTNHCLSQSIRSTTNKNRTTPHSYVHPSRLLAQMSTSKQQLSVHSTTNKNRTTTPQSFVHPSRLLAQMSISKQPLVNLNGNLTTFLPKTKVVSAVEEAEEKRKEERRHRRENKDDAVLKKKALMDDRIEQQRKKREEKERNVLVQKALKEREKAEMLTRVEKENEEKARLVQEREENMKKEIIRKKEEAKQKAAKIEERRVRKEAERLQALKLQEEEQQRLQAQKKKEQEDAERLHAKRLLEEKERKEKAAAMKEAALKLEKQKQAKNVVPEKVQDTTFVVDKPLLIPSSKYDYPLADLSKGNDSDFSEAEEDTIPRWANRDVLMKTLKSTSGISMKALLCYFGSKPTTPDLNDIFPNGRNKRVRSSSAHWRTPPRCSMLPNIL